MQKSSWDTEKVEHIDTSQKKKKKLKKIISIQKYPYTCNDHVS